MTPGTDTEQCDHCGEEKQVAWWYENGEAAVCGDCHEVELLERDRLRAKVERLTAELAGARQNAIDENAAGRRADARITAVIKLLSPLNDSDRLGPFTVYMIRKALATPGGPR